MLSGGAYSKKYQQLERERVQQVREQEKKSTRERALLLSKQTAQRQKALEEKKRAMAIAEEQRRRKALEDRRKAQHEATARFKSAICRIKSNPRAKRRPMDDVEIYLPDKTKPKAKLSADSLSGQTNRNAPGLSERVALGRDVEIKNGGHVSLQRRTSSLDDVLNQIRGGVDKSTPPNGHPPLTQAHGRIMIHQPVGSTAGQQQAATTNGEGEKANAFLLRGRSASDSNLNTLSRRSQATAKSHFADKHRQNGTVNSELEATKLKVEEVETSSSTSDELMVFKPVFNVGGARQYTTPTSRMVQCDDGTRVLSPEPANSSTSSSDRSLSPPLNDSLDQPAARYAVASVARQLRASRQQNEQATRRRLQTFSQKLPGSGETLQNGQHSLLKVMGVPATAHAPSPSPAPPPSSQPIYVCKSSDSDDHDTDSLNEVGSYSAAHQSKKLHQLQVGSPSSGASHTVNDKGSEVTQSAKAESEAQSSSKSEVAETTVTESKTKIVGILKKTSSSSVDSCQPGSSTGAVQMERSRSSGSQVSNASSASKMQKKVRFLIDKVDLGHSQGSHAPHSGSVWNRVLQNHVPNSAFTPKMRVSLSKASTVPPAANAPSKRTGSPSTLNGITVRVPVAPLESPSPQHTSHLDGKDEENSQKEVKKLNREVERATNEPSSSLKVNDVSLTKHERMPPTSVGPPATVKEAPSTAKAPSSSTKSLDKTPTDNEINDMWEQIRNCLEDNQQPGTPLQTMMNGMQRYTTASSTHEISALTAAPHSDTHLTRGHQQAASKTNEQSGIKLIHRQNSRSRPMRCHHQPNSTPVARRQQNHYHHSHSATYPQEEHHQHRVYPPGVQTSSREPELVVRATGSNINGRITPTSLSLEEQRLIQSIEKLNQRLKDHLARPPEPFFQPPSNGFISDYYPHPPRPPPPHHNSRSRGHMSWHPRPPLPTGGRTEHRTKTKNRHDFYDT